MNKKISIMGLTLVALLMSCSNGNNGPYRLKQCDEATAYYAAKNIVKNRERKWAALTEDKKINPLYSEVEIDPETGEIEYDYGLHFPTDVNQFSGECSIKSNYASSVNGVDIVNRVTDFKKTYNFDVDKCCYNCKITRTVTDVDGSKYVTPELNFYAFFVEDEEQEEKVKIDLNKMGTIYILINNGDIKIALNSPSRAKKILFYDLIKESFLRSRSSFSPYNVPVEPFLLNIMNFSEYNSDYVSDDILTANTLLDDFDSFISYYEELNMKFKSYEQDDIYAKIRYGSDDACSLSFDTDISFHEETPEEEGEEGKEKDTTIEKCSFVFQNLFLTENHLNQTIKQEVFRNNNLFGVVLVETQMDQTFTYGKASCTIPTDIEEYIPIYK